MKENRMHRSNSGSTALIVFIVLTGIVLAFTNIAVLMAAGSKGGTIPPLRELYRLPPFYLYFLIAPIVITVLLALQVRHQMRSAPPTAPAQPSSAPATPQPPSPAAALRLLSLLQQEGRLVDFLAEDIGTYSDAQVGAAVRAIHAGCRKALEDRIELQRILTGEDGSEVVVEPGFDPAAIRLTGNVAGQPPFHGTLQHGGWRAASVTLPETTGVSADIIAPAEVEIA